MFDVGFPELVLLFVIGLLVLGPERLPRVAAQLGRWMGKARRTAHQLRMQIEREMTMEDIMREQKKREADKASAAAGGADSSDTEEDFPEEDANDSGHRDAGADEGAGDALQAAEERPVDQPSAAEPPSSAGAQPASSSDDKNKEAGLV